MRRGRVGRCCALRPRAARRGRARTSTPRSRALRALLTQYAVAPSGALTALAPAALGSGAQDIAITPDGRFAYVTLSAGSDAGCDRAVRSRRRTARMAPAGRRSSAGQDPRGILVNPQGTRVIYANAITGTLHSRPIVADGTLGAATDRRPRAAAARASSR